MTAPTPAERHYVARQALREGLDDAHTDQPTIDRLWAEYDAALWDWLDDQSHRGTIEADPEYDDLEARTRDALIGYNDIAGGPQPIDDRIRR